MNVYASILLVNIIYYCLNVVVDLLRDNNYVYTACKQGWINH